MKNLIENVSKNLAKEGFTCWVGCGGVREVNQEFHLVNKIIRNKKIKDESEEITDSSLIEEGVKKIFVRVVQDGYMVLLIDYKRKIYYIYQKYSFNSVLKNSLKDVNDFEKVKKEVEDNGYIFKE
jgi:hypothetical protein